MFKKSLLAAVCTGVLAFGTIGLASENATLLLRSGERVSGQLDNMGGADFMITVNGGNRRIPLGDVVVIDFVGGASGLPDTEINAIPNDRHLIMFRDGSHMIGRVYDIRGFESQRGMQTESGDSVSLGRRQGDSGLRITFQTDSGERRFHSSEVGRIYMSRPLSSELSVNMTPNGRWRRRGDQTASGAIVPPPGSITVPGDQFWIPTSIIVRQGELVTFSSVGEVQLSTDANDMAGTAGSRNNRYAAGSPLPQALAGALIYKIGNSNQAYPLGDQTQIRMPASGQLFLGINDDFVGDNQGRFYVTIARDPQPTRR